MEFASIPGCGRSVVATRAYLPGEVVHEEVAYVMTPCLVGNGCVPNSSSKQTSKQSMQQNATATTSCITSVCVACFAAIKSSSCSGSALSTPTTRQTNDPRLIPAFDTVVLPTVCAECSAQYCSVACAQAYASEHAGMGECAVLKAITKSPSIRNKIPKEDFNTFLVACLVCAKAKAEGLEMLLQHHASSLSAPPPPPPPPPLSSAARSSVVPMNADLGGGDAAAYVVETVGLGAEPPLTSFRETCLVPTISTYDHIAHLVTNRSFMHPEIRSDFEALYPLYQKLQQLPQQRSSAQHDGSSINCGGGAAAVLPAVSFDVFVSICCAFLANGFGLWNAKGNGIATGFFPRSSFFNHSCAPNIGRDMNGRRATFFAAKHIQPGDPICLSYVDFKLHRDERQMKLKATYSFDCGCPRCSDPDAMDHREQYDVALCHDCKSKILRPEVSETPMFGVCPCCRYEYPLAE
jgi:hypothetical protein